MPRNKPSRMIETNGTSFPGSIDARDKVTEDDAERVIPTPINTMKPDDKMGR
jgi:hypothetical protein